MAEPVRAGRGDWPAFLRPSIGAQVQQKSGHFAGRRSPASRPSFAVVTASFVHNQDRFVFPAPESVLPVPQPFSSARRWRALLLLLGVAAPPGLATATPADAGPAIETGAEMTTPPAPAASPDEPAAPPLSPEQAEQLRTQNLISCSIPEEAEFFGFEWARRTSYRSVCLASHWLDGLFGDNPFDPKEGQVNGYFALITEKRQGNGLETTPRVRVRVKLPQASKRFDLFFDRDKESQSIAGESAALHPEATPEEASTNQVGVGYLLHKGVDELLNFRLGLRLRDWRPELFVRSTYAAILADSGTGRWNLEQTLFWKKAEGFGETTGLEYQRHLGGPHVFRWGSSATLSELSDGLRWNTTLSVFQALADDRGIQWSYGANGETRRPESVSNHGLRISYRQRLQRRWLVLEIYTGIDRIKDENHPQRESQAYLGARLEAHFNPQ